MLTADNPFASVSDLDHQLPRFADLREEHFRPAFEEGMARHLEEVRAITQDPEPPTFENTVVALERSGELLVRVSAVFFNLTTSDSTEGLRALDAELAPVLAAHRDAVLLDRALYERIDAVHRQRDALADEEQRRLVERHHTDVVRAGAALDTQDQARLRDLNQELSALRTAFNNLLLAETNDSAVLVADEADLDGLDDGEIASARQAAQARGHDSGYLLTLSLNTVQPALARLRDRGVRERLLLASARRGSRGGEHDTRATLTRMVALRAERAALLGHPDHASYVIADQTAGTVEAVERMLTGLVPAAVANAREEARELEDLLLADGEQAPLRAWDWAYYAERVRAQRFDLDADALRPYFEAGRVRDGVFRAATLLYGTTFTRRPDLSGPHPDAEVFEVLDGDGSSLGLFVADWFTRDSKRGGAWMSSFVTQSGLLGRRPVVVVNLNVPKPAPGEPALLTPTEVETAFHEFGHALHGLFSDVTYPRLAMTAVPRDFVEFPSQVNEMWAWWPEVLAGYAVHHETGEPLPQDVVERLVASRGFGQGFATVEYLAAALLDLAWHRRGPDEPPVTAEQVADFERSVLEQHGLALPAVLPRYGSAYFAHVFAGGYDAGYYSYIWSEVLDADTVEWFRENGGLRPDLGERFRRHLLSRGGAVDPLEAFERVRGRAPSLQPLLVRRGLAAAS